MPKGSNRMSQANLRLVEGTSVDKTKALDAALAQIERAFGKGSIMRLGKNQKAVGDRNHSDRFARPRHRAGRRRPAARPRRSRFTARNPRARPRSTLHAIAEAQKKGGVCAFVDAEHALDPDLCPQTRRRPRRSADLPARHRRTGAGNHRHAGALRRASTCWSIDSVAALARAPKSKARWAIRSPACRPA